MIEEHKDDPERTEELVRPLVGQGIAKVERALILGTLETCGGNRTRAAHILGVSVRTIHNKLRRWGFAALRDEDGRDDDPHPAKDHEPMAAAVAAPDGVGRVERAPGEGR